VDKLEVLKYINTVNTLRLKIISGEIRDKDKINVSIKIFDNILAALKCEIYYDKMRKTGD
jgi:hypothetical protein